MPKKQEAAPKKKPTKRKTNYLNNKDLLKQVIASKEQGQMSDELAKMLTLLTARYGKKGNFANYCVDEKTEALTKDGWKRYDQLSLSDEILSYDPDDGNLKWSIIKDIFINSDYDGMMHKLDTQGMDALVTPNHKFVSVERGIIPVEDIICNEHIVLTGAPVQSPERRYSDAFVEFVGWAVTEGHYIRGSVKKRCITISQKEGKNADKIRTALQSSDIPYKEYCWGRELVVFNCTGELVSETYDAIAPHRVLSHEFILSLTQEQRLILIETMVNADGWFRPNGGMSYVQKDRSHVDAFLMLCTIAGLTTSSVPMIYKTPASKKNPNGGVSDVVNINMFVTPKLQCKAERIDFHGGRASPGGRREQKKNKPTEHYKGTVWCPQTEYGTFICRRNKYIYVTGNTYNEDMQAYAMMSLVKTWNNFNPERSSNPFAFFTQCIKNSFIQYLKLEKRQRVIRDELLVDSGLTPSYNYQMEYEAQRHVHDEEDHEQHVKDAKELDEQEQKDDLLQY